jgi:hypothetical protein
LKCFLRDGLGLDGGAIDGDPLRALGGLVDLAGAVRHARRWNPLRGAIKGAWGKWEDLLQG